ncbi:MAG: exodeoxyribonuclease VII large subunit [Alphaproteobacteria bacterium]|uniref:Exodeoxyribonuclease 7 large subunit n=1 Tax=PS1 clade bacterium TaxID=2175152 RepID=A0A368DQJ4_9PROT|nr:exodeoxyribonuclease VII large subunit [Rhodobiaceae bacterium]MAU87262.1 exodeoxyribonuclease VII large subunit [Rhodobiaceae bacterium]OUT73495.1 MAG: exodeoxyribonuclease VII large subunit [Rhizobiales bacterium TMED25]OUT73941.1 MAG: exodeoxyribonuclease VII large subunit [Rhizobiales bacterium TMED25]RCL74107.1 MAG: exodeoxyribonuclease VII large subunit [PS1 clade bacterium]|tara:strand:+ start:4843 stop:6204 length:1362 start_codon:yes stop_codon:yes gene_type:complete
MNFVNENIPEYGVSEISAAIKQKIEDSFGYVKIKGEVSGLAIKNGIAYLKIKENDDVINAIIFNNAYRQLKIKPQDGLEVVVSGKITTYSKRGISSYQIQVDNIELAGEGALLALFEKLKKQLQEEGLFDNRFKKTISKYPRNIIIITSIHGAVIRDILRVYKDNGYPINISIYDVSVQGVKCPTEISEAVDRINLIEETNNLRPDIILIARGGGSLEDLWGFNDERLVRSVFNSTIPIVSAVGHETDNTLIDFVSDLRAPTPTSAANLLFPKIYEIESLIKNNQRLLFSNLNDKMEKHGMKHSQLENMIDFMGLNFITDMNLQFEKINSKISKQSLLANILSKKIEFESNLDFFSREKMKYIKDQRDNMTRRFDRIFNQIHSTLPLQKQQLEGLQRILQSLNYKNILKRGYTLIRGTDKEIIGSKYESKSYNSFNILFSDGEINVKKNQDKE